MWHSYCIKDGLWNAQRLTVSHIYADTNCLAALPCWKSRLSSPINLAQETRSAPLFHSALWEEDSFSECTDFKRLLHLISVQYFSTLPPPFPVCFSLSQTEHTLFFLLRRDASSQPDPDWSPLSFSSSQTLSSSSAANVIYLIWVINQFGPFLLFVERVDKAWSDNFLAPALIPLREGCLLARGEEEQQNILI